jgi:T5orf172 domain
VDADKLRQMIEEDEFGLLKIKPKTQATTAGERVVSQFAEVTEFVRREGREPEKNPSDMTEFQLAARLAALRGAPEHIEALQELDELGLLAEVAQPEEVEPPKSLAEVLDSDDVGLLHSPAEDIFTLRHVPAFKSKPEEIAQRRKCESFEDFAPRFAAVHADLRSGRRKLVDFETVQQIREGAFYVQKGVIVLVTHVGEIERKDEHIDTRLRCVYENGTESNILLRTLAKAVWADGKAVTEPHDVTLEKMGLAPNTPMASVYVLKSLSDSPDVTAIPHLHKIGSTSQSVEARTSGAAKDATFLGAPVKVADVYEIPKGSEKDLEKLLHHFFASARLDIWFENQDGKAVAEANEWFSVPLDQIAEAIELISAGTIGQFKYDRELQRIVLAGKD